MAYYGYNPFAHLFYWLFVKTGIIYGIFILIGLGFTYAGFVSNPMNTYEKVTATYKYIENPENFGWGGEGRFGWEYKSKKGMGVMWGSPNYLDSRYSYYGEEYDHEPGETLTFYIWKSDDLPSYFASESVKMSVSFTQMWIFFMGAALGLLIGGGGIGTMIYNRKQRRAAKSAEKASATA